MEMVDRGGGGCASLQLEFNFFATKESRKRAKRGLYTAEGRKEKEGWDGSGDSKRGERGSVRHVSRKIPFAQIGWPRFD